MSKTKDFIIKRQEEREEFYNSQEYRDTMDCMEMDAIIADIAKILQQSQEG